MKREGTEEEGGPGEGSWSPDEGAGGLAAFLGMPLPSCRTWIRFLLLSLGFPA